MNETSSTYRSPWLVSFTDGTPPDDLGDGLHWFPVGPTGDGRVMWRRPVVAVVAPKKPTRAAPHAVAAEGRRERADDDPDA